MLKGARGDKRAANAETAHRGRSGRRERNKSPTSTSKFGLDRTELQQAKIMLGLIGFVVVLGILIFQWIR